MTRRWITVGLLIAGACTGCLSRMDVARSARQSGDFERARKTWVSIARGGNAEGQLEAAKMLAVGQGGPRDVAEAARLYRSAAEQGQEEAGRRLGQLYLLGEGSPLEDPDAAKWIELGVESAGTDLMYQAALAFERGAIVERDTDRALYWVRRAADAWTSKNVILAQRLEKDGRLREFAELGFADAQFLLGRRYIEGVGVPLSLVEGAEWQRRAGAQGHRDAQFALGRIHTRGDGVPRDPAEGARWYLKAAEQGDAQAQYQLGIMYERGSGVPRDLVLSHMWFNLSAAGGVAKSRDQRDAVAERMGTRDRLEAERLAIERHRSWKAEGR